MRIVTKLFLLVFAAGLMASFAGCAGVGSTVQDNRREFNRVVDFDARMLVDDIMLFTQTRRPMRSSRWIMN